MSIITSTPEQINRSPHNSSTAKSLYSFPRAERFDALNRATSNDRFYTLPDSKAMRSTSFGYGKKYDFTAHVKSYPAPGHYKEVDKMYMYKKSGPTMAPGRDTVTFNDFLREKGGDTCPAPNAYGLSAFRKYNPPAYSLRTKNDMGSPCVTKATEATACQGQDTTR